MATSEERLDESRGGGKSKVIALRRRTPRDPEGRMSVVEHLEELRRRIMVMAVAFLAGSIVAWIFYKTFLTILTGPLDEGSRIGDIKVDGLNVGGITTAFTIRMKVSAFTGVVLALPVLLWQLWGFVTPGLRDKERRYAVPFVGAGLALFALGAWIAFMFLPQAIAFLLGFAEGPLKPLIFVEQYLSFVMFMVLAFGITFQFPLLLLSLAGVGVISSQWLRRSRRKAFIAMFVVAAVATPSGDPLTMTAMAVPLYMLFEGTLLIIRFAMKK